MKQPRPKRLTDSLMEALDKIEADAYARGWHDALTMVRKIALEKRPDPRLEITVKEIEEETR